MSFITPRIENFIPIPTAIQTAYLSPSPQSSSLGSLSPPSEIQEMSYARTSHPLLPDIIQLEISLANPNNSLSFERFNSLLNQVLKYCLEIECPIDSPLIVDKDLIGFIQDSLSILCRSFSKGQLLEVLYKPLKNFWKKVMEDWKQRSERLSEAFINTLNHPSAKFCFSNYILMEELLAIYSRSALFAKEPKDHQLIRSQFWQKNWLGVCRKFESLLAKTLHTDFYELWMIAEIEGLGSNWKTISVKEACKQLQKLRSYSFITAHKTVDEKPVLDLISLIQEREKRPFSPSFFYAPNQPKPALTIVTCYFTLKRGHQPMEKISWFLLKEWCETVLRMNDPMSQKKSAISNLMPFSLESPSIAMGGQPVVASYHQLRSLPGYLEGIDNGSMTNSDVGSYKKRSFSSMSESSFDFNDATSSEDQFFSSTSDEDFLNLLNQVP